MLQGNGTQLEAKTKAKAKEMSSGKEKGYEVEFNTLVCSTV